MQDVVVSLWGATAPIQITLVGELVAEINGKPLSAECLQHIVAYGFRQIIRDGGAVEAGSTDEDKSAGALKRVDNLLAGKFGGGGGGPRLTDVEREVREIARKEIAAKDRLDGVTSTQGAILKRVPAYIERNRARLEAKAQANLDALEAELLEAKATAQAMVEELDTEADEAAAA